MTDNKIAQNRFTDDTDPQLTEIKNSIDSVNEKLEAIKQNGVNENAASADILTALNNIAGKLDDLKSCCCVNGSAAGTIGSNIVYAIANGEQNTDGSAQLISCHRPLTSQAEADNVDVIVYLGSVKASYGPWKGAKFTLDSFATPGEFPIDLQAVNAYPCTIIRTQDRSAWFSLTRRDMMYLDWSPVTVYVYYDIIDNQERMCCGLYNHDYMGKVFYAQITDAENWTEEQKSRSVYFWLEDTIFYDRLPGSPMPDSQYTYQFPVTLDFHNFAATWGDLIAKFGDKPFGVQMPSNAPLLGRAFSI